MVATMLMLLGCGPTQSLVDPESFAKEILADSYAARVELGVIQSIEHVHEDNTGHVFQVVGERDKAKLIIVGRLIPGTQPSSTLHLSDGRQIPLFIDFLEDAYKGDWERLKGGQP